MERLLSDNMNHFDDLSEVVDISPSGQCRKRVPQPSNDAWLVAKRARHSGRGRIPAKACKHDAENGDFLINYFVIPRLAVAIVNILNMLCSHANIVISCTQLAGLFVKKIN